MSSLIRRIQKKGSKIGVKNPDARDLLSRLAREERRKLLADMSEEDSLSLPQTTKPRGRRRGTGTGNKFTTAHRLMKEAIVKSKEI